MPKYLELSAHVNLSSSIFGGCTASGTKKVVDCVVGGEHIGYVFTSPATGKDILIRDEVSGFNGDYVYPSFDQVISVEAKPETGHVKEEFAIMYGKIIYLNTCEHDMSGKIVDMIECKWNFEEKAE